MSIRQAALRRAGAVLAILLAAGAAGPAAAQTAPGAKVVVIGFDGMDPDLLQRFRDEGVMPSFDRFITGGALREFGTAIPPQSPVAWSNFITGMNAGGHGIFDFIHRDPQTMIPFLSTSDAKSPDKWWKLGSWKFPRGGGGVELLRKGKAFWEYLAEAGVDVTIFKVPSNFPPVDCAARTISGMGTPDILGTYGIFTYITDNPPADADFSGGRCLPVRIQDGRFTTSIPGPVNVYREGDPEADLPLEVVVDPVNPAATLTVGDETFLLQEGEWSDWKRLKFEMVPMFKSVSGACRFYLMEVRPHFRLYVSPVQIDPYDPEMPISTPAGYAREVAEGLGRPFFTQGMPDDTKALEEGVFSDAEYVTQTTLVLEERLAQFRSELERFRELDSGFLFFYFSAPDLTSHMMWRNMDPRSPRHADADPTYADRIRDTYRVLDEAFGAAQDMLAGATIIAMSDHGFSIYDRSFNLNTWLLENGYLHLKPGVQRGDVEFLQGIDWSRTRAYAIGINGLYLNLRGRERRGIVLPHEKEPLLEELVTRLEAVHDSETGRPVVKYAYRTDVIYAGPYQEIGPDIVMGYHRGFRGSDDCALGGIPETVIMDNMLKWSGDHCMAADEVQPADHPGRPQPAGHRPDRAAPFRHRAAGQHGGRRSVRPEGRELMFGGSKVKIEKDLLEKIRKYAGMAGYASPEEFVQHVLEREIAKFEEGGDSEDEIKKRMQGLGYIS
jgi:predicted AlkP superfamily phosphohydrolase/phosphomutase